MTTSENRPNTTTNGTNPGPGSDNWNSPSSSTYHSTYVPYTPIYPLPNTPTGPDYNTRLKDATRRVQKKINFYRTLTSYVVINGFLWILWMMTGVGYPWPIWVTLGWGIGLAFQFLDAFAFGVTDHQRQQMIDEEMRRMGYR